ncbi:MAG: serine hydrolase domain-containing protein, partial [Bacteroidota bacterium]
MKTSFLLSIFLFFLIACDNAEVVPAATYRCELTFPDEGAEHPQAAAFWELIDKALPYTTGIQVALTDNDGRTWTGARGFADIANQVPLETCHRLMIASISKVATAVLIMQLQEEGRLSVEDPLTDWLPEDLIGPLANSNEVSLRQLLNHTSGIPDYLTSRQTLNALNKPFLLETQREKLGYAYDLPATNAAGTTFSYSNTNYVLLGLVVEEALNQPLWEAVENRFKLPLGLRHFAMGTEQNPIPADVARPYLAFTNGKFIDVTASAVADAATGDGGIVTNLQDLNAWVTAV